MFEINLFLRYYAYIFPLKMYNGTITGLGFCDMQNYECLSKSYLDIDDSAYHKNLIQ